MEAGLGLPLQALPSVDVCLHSFLHRTVLGFSSVPKPLLPTGTARRRLRCACALSGNGRETTPAHEWLNETACHLFTRSKRKPRTPLVYTLNPVTTPCASRENFTVSNPEPPGLINHSARVIRPNHRPEVCPIIGLLNRVERLP